MKKQIIEVFTDLLKKNGKATTLEVKTALRKSIPTTKWNQSDVSDCMKEHADSKSIAFVDNGTHRTYLQPLTAKTVPVGGLKASTPISAGTIEKVNITKLIEIIANTKGHFFTITFKRKDGSVSTHNCQVIKDKLTNALGYLQLHTKEGIKQALPTNVIQVAAGKKVYVLK